VNIMSLKPGHDGCIAFVRDQQLIFSIEAEKDSFPRNGNVTAQLLVQALEMAPAFPDVLVLSGWHKVLPTLDTTIGSGYFGLNKPSVRSGHLFGKPINIFSSSHERSHIYMAAAMYGESPVKECLILVWEGRIGAFYRWRNGGGSLTRHHVLSEPGARYSALFALADPNFPDEGANLHHEYAGKVMALASYNPDQSLMEEDRIVVECLLHEKTFYPFRKLSYAGTGLHNCGVFFPRLHAALRYMSDRLFEVFLRTAETLAQRDLPLLIAGGCGLNCEWNSRWRDTKLFSEVFVAPCTNDSGSAIGSACDAMRYFGTPCHLNWSVYAGAPFDCDIDPATQGWHGRSADASELASCLHAGDIIAWIQGRYEIGPRALGHRSLLATPLSGHSRTLLNRIKEREDYRPIAPSCRSEELTEWFDPGIDDPYMLHFSKVRTKALAAITHVDGTARVHSVRKEMTPRFHQLLEAVRAQTGFGVVCNTSLNFKGHGFINRMSDLLSYCEIKRITNIVVDNTWYNSKTSLTEPHRGI
jgi:hydroxymethyl cephem carbamoyltransferase